jgi:8-oxo-dGTP pyrophosphatase MutT (NUDIX family)
MVTDIVICSTLLDYLMAYVGPGHYVVVALHVGGSKALNIKLVLQRKLRTRRTWFLAGWILPNEELVDAVVRKLLEETGLTLSHDDLTLLSDAPVRVALHEGQRRLVYVFSAYVPIPYVTTNIRTPAKLEHVVVAQSTINPDGSYVVPATIYIDGLCLTPAKQGLLPTLRRKFELIHFGCVTQWEIFRRVVYNQQVLSHEDTLLPRQFLFYPRFIIVENGLVWMLIKGSTSI